ncbi:PREDICTED: RNA-binding protein BRN1-like isoform X1 [Lupinus angustifolius]|uniref:RNA-binding protein BRN1-like isoform X1 n=1 Tax=Lupinus angustifolius TaxID=3871 RepID=UPI00092EBD43|nr:PREDICTED: RNA-binding protein BRN1-like isoform X1 [Lupinus angustifolius]
MSEMKEENKSNEESVKLFVGQVPKHMTEDELVTMFKEFVLVEQVNIIKDKATRASRGCCFLICPSREEADKAVDAYHNKKTLPGASSPLQVKYADGELERLEHKLFIGMLPKNVSEVEVTALFSNYGTIKDLQILRGSQQTSKVGCAFLKYETKEQALAALEAINGKHKMEGSSVPLVVKWADTEKERQARRAQKAQSEASNLPHADSQHPSLFGAMPMGYVPPYNGYGYQAPGGYGIMPYRFPPVQNQPGFHNMIPHTNQRPDLGPNMNPRNYPLHPASYVGSYPAVPGVQHPMAYPGGMSSPRPMNSSPGFISPAGGNSNSFTSSGTGKHSGGGQVEGPPGANLFIYHIPQEFGDEELATAFQPFGRVVSAKVFVDKATGVSKCFGFVSYDSPEAAESAISVMNGYQLGGKKLKVQLKRNTNQSKPY